VCWFHHFKGSRIVNFRNLCLPILLSCLAVPPFAGSPPVKSSTPPDSAAASCLALGASGETLANGKGCRNTETGAAIVCSGDQCTDYFADPRYKKIRAILDQNKVRPQQGRQIKL
jgi:hypothetical protein